MVATIIMLFFPLCGVWILGYLNISKAAFKIAVGIIIFLVVLDMLAAKRQTRKCAESTGDGPADKIDSHNLAILLLAGPSAIISMIVVNAGFASRIAGMMTGDAALIMVMVAIVIILCVPVIAKDWLNEKSK